MTSPQTIRAFIAVELPPPIKQELDRVSKVFAAQLPPRAVRWVQPEKMHLTLRFLGDTAVNQLPDLSRALDQLAAEHPSFPLQLNQPGCFPNPKRPRVIWVGVTGEKAALLALKQGLDQRLEPLGWAAEGKPFSAHLTIGRVGNGRLPATMSWDVTVSPVSFTVDSIHIIESQLTPKGPIYTIRHTAVLRRQTRDE